jgi:hypothetical protein
MGRAEDFNQRRRKQLLVDTAASAKILDRFGRVLVPGAQVVYRSPIDLVFTVADVAPVLDPRAQAGLHQVKLLCEVTLPAMDRLPVDLLIMVAAPRTAADQAADNGDQRAEAEALPAKDTPAPASLIVLPPGTAVDAEEPAAPDSSGAPPKFDDEP